MSGAEGLDDDQPYAEGDTRRHGDDHHAAHHRVDGDEPAVVPSSVEALRTTVTRLREENDHLNRALRHRSIIEQAKGVLMARMAIGADEAFARIRKLSQDANQRVTRVAAAIVASAEARTARPHVSEVAPFEWSSDAERAADVLLAGAAIEQARDLDELARTVVNEAAKPFGVSAALIGVLEPDGSLRLVAGHGYPAQVLSTWHRLPADLDVPLLAAVRTRSSLFFSTREEREAAFPTTRQIPADFEAQASCPLIANGSVIGVIGLSWPEAVEFDEVTRTSLEFVAASCTEAVTFLLRRDGDAMSSVTIDAAGARWFRAVLDAIVTPVCLLAPVRDEHGATQDFRFEFCNAATVDLLGRSGDELLDRTMVELYPDLVGSGVLDGFRRAFEGAQVFRFPPTEVAHRDRDGVIRHGRYDMAVARLGDRLLLSWTVTPPTE